MSRASLLHRDLERLAREQRVGGDLPSAEQLMALRDGELGEDEAEALRDRLALDPQLADLYLRLASSQDETADEKALPAGQIEERLQALKEEVLETPSPSAEMIPMSRRFPWLVAAAALAATLLVVVGLWDRAPVDGPTGKYHRILVTVGEPRGGGEEMVAADEDGVELQIDSSDRLLDALQVNEGPIDFQLRAVASGVLWTELGRDIKTPGPLILRIDRKTFVKSRDSYQLWAQASGVDGWTVVWRGRLTFKS